ncbi:16S rRNA (cytidine(1402)-2'-O)-methyltransferase [Desulfoplanes sp.]
MSSMQARLWVVATPLGNLGDISPRAVGVIENAGLILAEDTRRAGLLFKHLGIASHARMVSAFDHNESSRVSLVLGTLAKGHDVVLLSDAGTPLIADPGFVIVRACREAGHGVSPVPGPCAPIAALMASGLPTTPFVFLGFFPRKKNDIRETLRPYVPIGATLVFFERKNRLAVSLGIAHEILGERPFCVARELTKLHEDFIFGNLGSGGDIDQLASGEIKGECTVVIGPGDDDGTVSGRGDVRAILDQEEDRGGKPREIAKRVASRVRGWTPKEVYALRQGGTSCGPE